MRPRGKGQCASGGNRVTEDHGGAVAIVWSGLSSGGRPQSGHGAKARRVVPCEWPWSEGVWGYWCPRGVLVGGTAQGKAKPRTSGAQADATAAKSAKVL